MTERYELPEELRLTKNLVRDFNRNEIIPLEQQIPHDSITIPEDDYLRLSKKTREMGLWCLGVPEEYGGAGADFLYSAIVIEELAYSRCHGLHIPLHSFSIHNRKAQ